MDVDETDHPEKKKTSLRNFPSIFFRLLKKKNGTLALRDIVKDGVARQQHNYSVAIS